MFERPEFLKSGRDLEDEARDTWKWSGPDFY